MKFYRWMSNDEFYKMQRGETIYGIDHTKKNNTTSKGVCFFPKEMKVKLVEDEYRNIDVRPVDLTPTEILDLENDTDNEYDGADGNLAFLPAFVNRDVFVEFEMDEKNIIPFLDSYNINEQPKDKMVENWGVYCKPNGAWADKILVFEYAIDHYDKNILKPTRFMSFHLFDRPSLDDKLNDSDFKPYTDTVKLNNELYVNIDNSNITEYSFLYDLRQAYAERVVNDLVNIHLFYKNSKDVSDNIKTEMYERKFIKTIENMYKDGATSEQIRDVCCYGLDTYFSDSSLEDYKYYIENGIEDSFDLFNEGKNLSHYIERMITFDLNNFHICNLIEEGKEDFYHSQKYDKSYLSADLKQLTLDLISYKKENDEKCSIEKIVKEVDNIANETGVRYIDEDRNGINNSFREFLKDFINENENELLN